MPEPESEIWAKLSSPPAISKMIFLSVSLTFICTDIEHGDAIDPNVVALSQGADLLIHEAQYTGEELKTKRGWGHSSYEQALQVAERAGAKMLAITHHDPDHDDEFLRRMERECQQRFRACVLARERMEIAL